MAVAGCANKGYRPPDGGDDVYAMLVVPSVGCLRLLATSCPRFPPSFLLCRCIVTPRAARGSMPTSSFPPILLVRSALDTAISVPPPPWPSASATNTNVKSELQYRALSTSHSASLLALHNPGTVPSPRFQQRKSLWSQWLLLLAQSWSRTVAKPVHFSSGLALHPTLPTSIVFSLAKGSFCSMWPHPAHDPPRRKTPYSLSAPALACKRRHLADESCAPS